MPSWLALDVTSQPLHNLANWGRSLPVSRDFRLLRKLPEIRLPLELLVHAAER